MINKGVHGYKMCVSPSIDFAHFMDVLVLTANSVPGQVYAGCISGLSGTYCTFYSSGETRRNICKAIAKVSLSNIMQSSWCSEVFFGQPQLSREGLLYRCPPSL